MKKVSQELDDQLLLYLDGQLNSAAREGFELALKQNDALRQRLAQLQEMETSMKKNIVEEPSKNFTQLVMQKLDHYQAPSSSFTMFNGILLLVGILLLTGIATVLVSSGVFDQATGTIDLNTIQLPKQYIQRSLPSISIDGKLVINVIILLNLGLGWVVFDRTILKPLFRRRMQMLR